MTSKKTQKLAGLQGFGFLLQFASVLTTVLLAGCMETTQDNVSPPSVAAFAGAVSAQNLDGSRIQVTWGAVPPGYGSVQIDQVNSDGTLTIVNSASVGANSYVVTGLNPSTLYSYVVQACGSTGASCDGNHNVVSALTYAGINSTVSITSLTVGTSVTSGAASVTFPGPGPEASGVNVYCHTSWNKTDVLAGSLSTSAPATSTMSLTLSGFYTGTNYVCHAQAVIAATGTLDGNIQTLQFQTKSMSFSAYQGVSLVQAYGDAPAAPSSLTMPVPTGAPVALNSGTGMTGIVSGNVGGTIYIPVSTPTTRRVIITWQSFNIASPLNAVYKMVRVPEGGIIDMTTTTLCTPTTATACQVCVSSAGTNAFSRTCTDAAIGAAPNRYQYAVTLVVLPTLIAGNGTYPAAEQMPSTAYFAPGDLPFRIDVPIPPSYMVLVHRDSVNFEMCSLMGQTPIPPQNDPRGTGFGIYHTTCSYNGLGATPGNVTQGNMNPANSVYAAENIPQNLGSTSNYDFGYNLFVDRFEAGCNWTPAANGAGGMCVVNGTAGDCYGSSVPTSTQGVDGNVYYDYATSACYVNQRGAWLVAGSGSLDQPHLAASYSISPSAGMDAPSVTMRRVPPLIPPFVGTFNSQQVASQNICQSVSDANTTGQGNLTTSLASSFYGPKRLLRRREQIAAAGFQWMPADPAPLTLAQIGVLQTGNAIHISSAEANYTNLPYTQSCNTGQSYATNGDEVSLNSNTNGMNPAEWAGSTSVTNMFMIGADYTAKCTSRFGAQDMVGNINQYLAEDILAGGTANTSAIIMSSVDSSDADLTNFAFNNVEAPELYGYSYVENNTGNDSTFTTLGTFNFLTPFGLPLESSSSAGGSNPLSLTSMAQYINFDAMGASPSVANTPLGMASSGTYTVSGLTGFVPSQAAGRFFITDMGSGGNSSLFGFRCGMPAEIPQ